MAEGTIKDCAQVLHKNASHGYTVPSRELYPHQWLWDSCFTAIGLRHVSLKRARQELISLKRGAWANGMLPNIIFHDNFLNYDHTLWQSKQFPQAPRSFNTTCITQPPMLAEAVYKVGQKLDQEDRKKWFSSMFDTIVNYHLWLYENRNPDGDGLIILLHPYESGLDNSPPWIHRVNKIKFPWWIRSLNSHSATVIVNHFRRDTKYVPISQRVGLKEAAECFYIIRKLASKSYMFDRKFRRKIPVLQDLTFNCILIRANRCLLEIAQELGKPLPKALLTHMELSQASLEKLWDEPNQQYYSRDYFTKKLVKQSSIASLMPLYAGSISKKRAVQLLEKLENPQSFGLPFPIPSVASNSKWFNSDRYWQGPSWINTNWLITEGLQRYGFNAHAKKIALSSIDMVAAGGSYEYFNSLNGAPRGAKDFSWTAALTIDLQVCYGKS